VCIAESVNALVISRVALLLTGCTHMGAEVLLLSLGDCARVQEGKAEMSKDTAGRTHVERTQHRSNFPSAPRVEIGDKPKQGRSADNTGMRRG
jgi:hypothetical protein